MSDADERTERETAAARMEEAKRRLESLHSKMLKNLTVGQAVEATAFLNMSLYHVGARAWIKELCDPQKQLTDARIRELRALIWELVP